MHKGQPTNLDESARNESKAVIVFIITTFVVSWILWMPLAIDAIFKTHTPRLPGQFFLASFGPLAGGIAASYYRGGQSGLTAWLRAIFRFRLSPKIYYLISAMLTAYFLISLLTIWICTGTLNSLRFLGDTEKLPGVPHVLVLGVWMLVLAWGKNPVGAAGFTPFLLKSIHTSRPPLG
ncbi:hypothetical protein [Dyadobacter sp. 50-39]|uniref:hypothetical protein n=1 Tax=Dyadobacter sp. 50-39 TaxID=1895756 RepID=UPI000A64C77A|nr:hypothetical protein [Dyadobacter sp. 50-39]